MLFFFLKFVLIVQPNIFAQLTAVQQQHGSRIMFACAYSEFFAIVLLIIQVFR
jgi:hypothetical protein